MGAKAKFEVYEGFTKRKKKYIVSDINISEKEFYDLLDFSRRFFKCSAAHLQFTDGYIWDGELYLELTEAIFGAKPVNVITYVRQAIDIPQDT